MYVWTNDVFGNWCGFDALEITRAVVDETPNDIFKKMENEIRLHERDGDYIYV